jgi:hypothetical protein
VEALGEPAGLVPGLAGPKVYPMADLLRGTCGRAVSTDRCCRSGCRGRSAARTGAARTCRSKGPWAALSDRVGTLLCSLEESGTLDRLGLDTFAAMVSPGTSTIQTPLRHFVLLEDIKGGGVQRTPPGKGEPRNLSGPATVVLHMTAADTWRRFPGDIARCWDLVRAGVLSAARRRPRLPFSRRQSLRSVGRAAELRVKPHPALLACFPPFVSLICFVLGFLP